MILIVLDEYSPVLRNRKIQLLTLVGVHGHSHQAKKYSTPKNIYRENIDEKRATLPKKGSGCSFFIEYCIIMPNS